MVNCWLKNSVILHNALDGFRTGIGTGTVRLEDKLAQKLVGLAHKFLFQVFLDIQRDYEMLDQEQYL